MTPDDNNYFLHTICHLREREEMLIYDRWTSITTEAEDEAGDFLRSEYEKERTGFPFVPPPFDQAAAVWGGKIVFYSSQLLLSREKGEKDIRLVLSPYPGEITVSAILSADLCLRCLPDVIGKAREINPDDPLIGWLEAILSVWHYSGVGILSGPDPDWTLIAENDCLRQLYMDRIIERKAALLVRVPFLGSGVRAAMGDHGDFFWKEL